MKIFIMTDLEGCAGVMNAQDWIYPTSRYYEKACELATLEASAAVEGALEGGATEVVVVDGHGAGAMRRDLLHPRARLLGGRPWPREMVTYGFDGTERRAKEVRQAKHIAATKANAPQGQRVNQHRHGCPFVAAQNLRHHALQRISRMKNGNDDQQSGSDVAHLLIGGIPTGN